MKYFTQPPLGTPLNFAHPLNRELVGYWPMGEGAGIRAQDLSGKGNHGTLTNMVQGSTSGWTGGKFGRAMRFDGVDDYLVIPDTPSLSFGDGVNDRPFSISMWLKADSFNANYQWLFNKRGNLSNSEYQLVLTPTGQLYMNLFSGGVGTVYMEVISVQVIRLNTWHNIVYTYDGSKTNAGQQFYIDGVLSTKTGVNGGVYVAMQDGTVNLHIGIRAWDYGTNAKFVGVMEQVRLYNRNLSALEARQLYTDPFCMYEQKNNFRWFSTFDRKGSFFFSRL